MNPCNGTRLHVFNVFSGTTHDGPGLRLTFFLQGCPLKCRWCQNPEGISAENAIWWDEKECIGCGTCVAHCPAGALQITEGGIHPDPGLCQRCGTCVRLCPGKALQLIGREWTIDEMVERARSMTEWFRSFGGGVTVSGGEPLYQAAAVAELFRRLHQEGIHTALDTSGYAAWPDMKTVLTETDCLLLDIKFLDRAKHLEWTGRPNDMILDHAVKAAALADERGLNIWIRTPLIPGATATAENLRAISQFLSPLERQVSRWELCAFNGLCRDKYRKLGRDWSFADVPPLKAQLAHQLRAAACEGGFPAEKIILTGIIHE